MPNGFSDFDYYSGNFIGLINVEFVSSFTSELVNYISQAIEPWKYLNKNCIHHFSMYICNNAKIVTKTF